LADLQRTVYPHSGHPLAEGRAQDGVSSPAKDQRSANCTTQPTKIKFKFFAERKQSAIPISKS